MLAHVSLFLLTQELLANAKSPPEAVNVSGSLFFSLFLSSSCTVYTHACLGGGIRLDEVKKKEGKIITPAVTQPHLIINAGARTAPDERKHMYIVTTSSKSFNRETFGFPPSRAVIKIS